MKFYVAGPMRGIPQANFPMFDRARDFLRAHDHIAISPADHDRDLGLSDEDASNWTGDFSIDTFHTVMAWDLQQVIDADAILLLPGWEDSTGANIELTVARATGRRIFYFLPSDMPRANPDSTVLCSGDFMEEEQPVQLVGLSGFAQSGKDTTGSVLVEEYGFTRLAFADALKDVLYDLNPIVRPKTEYRWTEAPLAHLVDTFGWEWVKANTDARELLQRLGVAVREHVSVDAWVNAVLSQVEPGGKYVITDVRFPNEAAAINKLGGDVWRVEREGHRPPNDHVSEHALDDWQFDARIRAADYHDDIPALKRGLANEVGFLLEELFAEAA